MASTPSANRAGSASHRTSTSDRGPPGCAPAEQNDGILTLATTNHAERLDPAILDRPSRFDRKYHFGLPAHGERAAYIALWHRRLGVAGILREQMRSEALHGTRPPELSAVPVTESDDEDD